MPGLLQLAKNGQLKAGASYTRVVKIGTMLHLIWYLIVGLIAGVVAKSVMHMHLTLVWTIILGIIGSLVGGCVTHMFSRPREGAQFHPAGIIFSILGAILVLFICVKLKIHLPAL
jgi:uncharacterized membrane protein YeaQ/YmgE (transglycosylase-associated protein family)